MDITQKFSRKIPGPGALELIRWGSLIQKDPLKAYTLMREKYGDVAWCPWPNRKSLFLWHPNDIRHVLKDNHTNYVKTAQYKELKPLLGEGLLTSNGELWRNQRKLMAKQFHGKAIDAYTSSMKRIIDETVDHHFVGKLDLDQFFSKLTLKVAADVFFGADGQKFSASISDGLSFEMEAANKNMRSVISFPLCIPTPTNMKRRKGLKTMNSVVEDIMDEDHRGKPENILTKLISGSGIDPKQIRDEVMTLLLAGHETTSNQLMWTSWLLALHPQWQEKIRVELREYGKDFHELMREDLPHLKILNGVLQEALRLMPPIPAIARTTIKEDTIGDYEIGPGVTIILQPWVTQRDERFWTDPLSFQPERFIGREEKREDYSFFPFAKGARACIGEDLAMVEASLILIRMLECYEWRMSQDFEPMPVHHLTLRSQNGMMVELHPRRTK